MSDRAPPGWLPRAGSPGAPGVGPQWAPLGLQGVVAQPVARAELPSEDRNPGPPQGDDRGHWNDQQWKAVWRSSGSELQRGHYYSPPPSALLF